ncbi:hypothetical protein BA6E_125171 [Bacteroidales bacterium 6E]|nr:hypothetical protein BA6E_125171 [Bacteroidales bacterium 6E]
MIIGKIWHLPVFQFDYLSLAYKYEFLYFSPIMGIYLPFWAHLMHNKIRKYLIFNPYLF